MTDVKRNLARQLRERRILLGESQVRVAVRAGFHPVTLQNWESGRRLPADMADWRSWARALGGEFTVNLQLPEVK